MKNQEPKQDNKTSQIPLIISAVISILMIKSTNGLGFIWGGIGGVIIFTSSFVFYEHTITFCEKKNIPLFFSKIIAGFASLLGSLIVMFLYLAIVSLILYQKL